MAFAGFAIVAFLATAVLHARFVGQAAFIRTYLSEIGIFVVDFVLKILVHGHDATIDAYARVAIFVPPLIAAIAETARARAWNRAAEDSLELALPFEGRWRVVAGGAWPARNHHLVASDQRFAYDFVRIDGESAGTLLLAPFAGRVVATSDGAPDHAPSARVIEDAAPFGNFVAIANGRATVIMAHMQCRSVRVRMGDEIAAGTPVGACGNSGRTTRPHLHIHAQLEPEPAPFRATGVPIAFARGDRFVVARPGDVFGEERPAHATETP